VGGDAPAGAQHVTGDCQFVGGRANILRGAMEDEVFKIDEFTVDPQRGAGIGEMGPFDKTLTDRRAGDALVETGQCDCGFSLVISNRKLSYTGEV
jgi:hypothetical protein